MREFKYKRALTHGGVFHADDVFSTAFIKMINPEIEIERGNFVPPDYDGLVYDIGFGEFDHHQSNNEIRENGIQYASFGKLWRAFAPGRFSETVIRQMDGDFISPIDDSDTGGTKSQLSEAVKLFNPTWDSKQDTISAFNEAVKFAETIFKKKIEYIQSEENAEAIVNDAIEKSVDGIVTLPYYCPWNRAVMQVPSVKFIIFPSNREGFCVRTVPVKEDRTQNRVSFPKRWLGNPDSALGMTFCHPGNFLAVTDTEEQAIEVARVAIAENENI